MRRRTANAACGCTHGQLAGNVVGADLAAFHGALKRINLRVKVQSGAFGEQLVGIYFHAPWNQDAVDLDKDQPVRQVRGLGPHKWLFGPWLHVHVTLLIVSDLPEIQRKVAAIENTVRRCAERVAHLEHHGVRVVHL
jgi:hypothetical protein